MKRILVPTDFSSCADKALTYATEIARRAQAEIILIHAADQATNRSEDEFEPEEYNQSISVDVDKRLETIKQNAVQKEHLPILTKVYERSLQESIQEAADTYKPDLVVMGTHGASDFKKKIMGSNTANTISQVSIPVLTIPTTYDRFELKEVALAIHAEEALNNLAPAFELADLFGARIRLIIFSEASADAATFITDRRTIIYIQTKLQETYSKTHMEVEHLSGSDFYDTIQEFIDKNKIDLLVMITHKRGKIEGLFNRSLTRKMAYHTTVPLLSIHP